MGRRRSLTVGFRRGSTNVQTSYEVPAFRVMKPLFAKDRESVLARFRLPADEDAIRFVLSDNERIWARVAALAVRKFEHDPGRLTGSAGFA